MAKLKLLKMPKAPRLPKKPAATASLSTKQSWLRRVQDMKAKYEAKERAVFKENTERKKMNEASKKLSTVIAGVGDIMSIRPGSFKAVISRKKRSSKVSGVKKRKPAAKKTAKKKAPAKKRRY